MVRISSAVAVGIVSAGLIVCPSPAGATVQAVQLTGAGLPLGGGTALIRTPPATLSSGWRVI